MCRPGSLVIVDRLLDRLGRYWLAPMPPERLATLRILGGLFAWIYVTARLPHFGDFTRLAEFRPVGLVTLLTEPLPPIATWAIAIATCLLGFGFTLGWRFRLTGPLFAAALLWVTSYASSWGMIFHTENLIVLHVIVLGLSASADRWSLDARPTMAAGRDGAAPPNETATSDEEREALHERYGWPVRLICTLTVLTYFIAGYTKLRVSGLSWVTSDLLQNYIAYDALRKAELGSIHSPVGAWLASVPGVWQPIAAISLAMELGAPLALIGRRIAAAWALAAWLFHVGVAALMAIVFLYPVLGLAFASFFPVEQPARRVAEAIAAKCRRRKSRRCAHARKSGDAGV